VSTTGQGDFPLNARGFWKTLLLKRLPATFLSGVQYTQFGLGDSSYPKYVDFYLALLVVNAKNYQ
jgi:sulfite reductase alpha subunit-like flavoprotein